MTSYSERAHRDGLDGVFSLKVENWLILRKTPRLYIAHGPRAKKEVVDPRDNWQPNILYWPTQWELSDELITNKIRTSYQKL